MSTPFTATEVHEEVRELVALSAHLQGAIEAVSRKAQNANFRSTSFRQAELVDTLDNLTCQVQDVNEQLDRFRVGLYQLEVRKVVFKKV